MKGLTKEVDSPGFLSGFWIGQGMALDVRRLPSAAEMMLQ
jgi:hypothetical protein